MIRGPRHRAANQHLAPAKRHARSGQTARQRRADRAANAKTLLAKLNGLGLTDVLIVSDAVDENLYLAARNLPHVDVRDVQGSDPVSLIAYEKVLVTVSAVKKFEELLG